jgi:hypothetical protein
MIYFLQQWQRRWRKKINSSYGDDNTTRKTSKREEESIKLISMQNLE